MSDTKTAAYICKGCGLGDRLDGNRLAKIAESEGKSDLVRQHDFLCNRDGVALIQQDIDDGVTHVVVAACSRRAKTDAFAFDQVAMARANLREGVIWVRPQQDETQETTQEMADDYVRMACAEIRYMQTPTASVEVGTNKRILVVGGGITGMTAAVEAAKTGYNVLLVEKSGALGGWAAKLWRRIPTVEPYADPEDNGVAALVQQVQDNLQITVFLNSTITRTRLSAHKKPD